MDLVYDKDYTGPRWTYGLTYRPAAYGAVPDGRIVGADVLGSTMFAHGTIQYPFELTEAQVAGFQLTPVPNEKSRTAQ